MPSGGVTLWAAFGAAWTVFALVGWGRWIFSDKFAPAPKGLDKISDFHLLLINAYQVFAVCLLIALVAVYIVKPWLRTRHLSLDGMLLIGCMFAYYMDVAINYVHQDTFAWNAYALNMGSWGSFFPGSTAGSHNYAEGLAWAMPDYMVFGTIVAIWGCWMLIRLKGRYPMLSTPAAFCILFVILYVGLSILEILRIRFELYGYARTLKALTLWAGSQYQWPLYESLFTGCFGLAFIYVRWSWITKGSSFVDAGIEKLNVSEGIRQYILLFAVVGFCVSAFGVFYFIPWAITSLGADSIAILPSYMRPGP
jgi:hypothetical protein